MLSWRMVRAALLRSLAGQPKLDNGWMKTVRLLNSTQHIGMRRKSGDEKGTPSQLNATYWHSLTPARSVVETADELGSLPSPSKPSAWRSHREASRPASGGMTAQAQRTANPAKSVNAGFGHGKMLSALAAGGGWIVRRRRSIVTMAACLLVGATFGPFLYRGDLGEWLLHRTASESDSGLTQALRQEQEQANKLAGDVTVARLEAEAQAALVRQASEAADRDKEVSERALVGLRQALQLELFKTEKLTGQLAEAQRDSAAKITLTRKTIDDAARAEAKRSASLASCAKH